MEINQFNLYNKIAFQTMQSQDQTHRRVVEYHHGGSAQSSHDEPYEIGNQASAAKTRTVIKYESPSEDAFNVPYLARSTTVYGSNEPQIGSWKDESVEDIETYLVNSQRKFVKYRLNIFVLNRCVLRIQHSWLKNRDRKRAAAEAEAQRQHKEQRIREAFQAQQQLQNMQSFGGSQVETEQVAHGHSSVATSTSTKKTLSIRPVDFDSGDGNMLQQRQQVVDGHGSANQQMVTTTSQFAVITEEAHGQNAQEQNQAKSTMQNSMQKWAQQQVAVASSGRQPRGGISTTTTTTTVQMRAKRPGGKGMDHGAAVNALSSERESASSTVLHQSTPSFKTTNVDENVEVNKAFRFNQKTAGKQQLTAASNASQTNTARKGSPPTHQTRQHSEATATITKGQPQTRSGSTLMAATAASKSRAAEVQMRQGSGTHRQQFTTVQKSSGGVTTTTTTTLTTTYTKNGQVVGKSKSTERTGRQRPRTSMQTSTSTTSMTKPASSNVEIQKTTQTAAQSTNRVEAAAKEQPNFAQYNSLTTITESRQTVGSSPMQSQQPADKAQVEEANNFINEYIKQSVKSSARQSSDKLKENEQEPPVAQQRPVNEVQEQRISEETSKKNVSNQSSARKQNALAIVTDSDMVAGYSERHSLLTEETSLLQHNQQMSAHKNNHRYRQRDATNYDQVENTYAEEDTTTMQSQNNRQQPPQHQQNDESSHLLSYLNTKTKIAATPGKETPGAKSPRGNDSYARGHDQYAQGGATQGLQIEIEESKQQHEVGKVRQDSSDKQSQLEKAEHSMGQRVVEHTWTKFEERERTKTLLIKEDEPLKETAEQQRQMIDSNSNSATGLAERIATHQFSQHQQQYQQQQPQRQSESQSPPSASLIRDQQDSQRTEVQQQQVTTTTTTTMTMAERVAGQKWDQIQQQQVQQQQQQLQEKLMNPILSRKTQATGPSQSQSQAKLPTAQNPGFKALDMKSVVTMQGEMQGYNNQSSRQPQTSQNLTDAHNQSTSRMNKTTVTDHDEQSMSKTSRNEPKSRSISALSARSTFSMEQKKVQHSQNLNSDQVAAHSFSRFQERQSRKASRGENTAITKVSKVHLSPGQLSKQTASMMSDKESRLTRQEHSMKSLMMPTCSSKLKMRQKSTSRERSCEATMHGADISNNYSSQQTKSNRKSSRKGSVNYPGASTNLEVRTKQLDTDRNQGSANRNSGYRTREVQSTKSASKLSSQNKNTHSRYGLATTTHHTTVTRNFVNGKEVSSTTETHKSKGAGQNSSRNYFQTPRYATSTKTTEIRNNTALTSRQKSPSTLHQSPKRTRNTVLSTSNNQSVNQQGRSNQQTRLNKTTTTTTTVTGTNHHNSRASAGPQLYNRSTAVRETQYVRQQEGGAQQLPVQTRTTTITVNSAESPPSRKSLQAGGNNDCREVHQQYSEDNYRPNVGNQIDIVQEEITDDTYPVQAPKLKKMSNSFNQTSSQKPHHKGHKPSLSHKDDSEFIVVDMQEHKIVSSPPDPAPKKLQQNEKMTTVTTTTYNFKNVPSAAEQRALKRQQKQMDQVELTEVVHKDMSEQLINTSGANNNTNANNDSSVLTIDRKSSKRQFAFAQPPPANSASRRQLRSKQQSIAQAARSPNRQSSEASSIKEVNQQQQQASSKEQLIQSEQQTRSKDMIRSTEKAAMHASSEQEAVMQQEIIMTGQQQNQQQQECEKVNNYGHSGTDGSVVTTTTHVRRSKMVDSEPMAFNMGSAAASGKSTDSANVVLAQEKQMIVHTAPVVTSNQKINERYLAVDQNQNNEQQTVTVIQEMQLNEMTLVPKSLATILETEYKEDTKQHLLKCLNQDLDYSKIQKQFSKDFAAIKDVLRKHFEDLNAVFIYYSGQSHAYPAIAIEDFISFCEECGILSHSVINEKTLQRCFQETTVSTNSYKKTGEKSLYRYEFLEILIHISAYLFGKQPPRQKGKTKEQILDTLITEKILRNAQCVNRVNFRRYLVADQQVCELLAKNDTVLRACYDYFSTANKKTVTLEECVALSRQLQLDVPDQILGVVFAESLMTVIDTVSKRERMYQLQYPEFLYFLCKITEVHYTNTEYEEQQFYIKLDNMLPHLLEPMDLVPEFSFSVPIANQEELEDQVPEQQSLLTSSQTKMMRERLYNSAIESKTESNRDQEDENEVLEYQPSEIGTSQLGTKVNVSAANDAQDSDIQAWPQPSPIAYPQMQEMPNDTPLLTVETPQNDERPENLGVPASQGNRASALMMGPEQHAIQVVERRSSRKTTAGGNMQVPKKSIVMNSQRSGQHTTVKTSSSRTGLTTTTYTTTTTTSGFKKSSGQRQ